LSPQRCAARVGYPASHRNIRLGLSGSNVPTYVDKASMTTEKTFYNVARVVLTFINIFLTFFLGSKVTSLNASGFDILLEYFSARRSLLCWRHAFQSKNIWPTDICSTLTRTLSLQSRLVLAELGSHSQTIFRPNVCRPNVCRPNVHRPKVAELLPILISC
jgi:hypothetical protein